MMQCYLGVMATSKGLVVGDLKYTNVEGVTVDCNLAVGGDTIPQDVSSIHVTCSDARDRCILTISFYTLILSLFATFFITEYILYSISRIEVVSP